jgi:hypothetical protein
MEREKYRLVETLGLPSLDSWFEEIRSAEDFQK